MNFSNSENLYIIYVLKWAHLWIEKYHGLNSVTNLAPGIWEHLPDAIRHCNSLKNNKKLIKFCVPKQCPCRLCKTYTGEICFIWSEYTVWIAEVDLLFFFFVTRICCLVDLIRHIAYSRCVLHLQIDLIIVQIVSVARILVRTIK